MVERVFQNYRCWQPERISNVINKVAIAVDDAIFMATHTPFKTIRDEKSKPGVTSEEELLAELWRCADNDQHAFIVVQGIPGTGKSHLIRWLQNRYQAKSSKDEIVLLIKRANNSLRQTLLQILEKGIFEDEVFAVYKKKLEEATRHLSERGLEDTLINSLQVAHGEVDLPQDKRPSSSIGKRLEYFLLDPLIRNELRSEDGAIKRITRHISGSRRDFQNDHPPTFFASDFDFNLELRQRLQRSTDGYRETKDLVNKLVNEKYRQDLADYLNELLEFAIGQATALTSDDFKRMFFDLRRELRKQGRSLILFIEDITAFTGLAAGLVDVLAEEHREANPEFCRLTSVIGITDYFYNSHFPDNMKDRVTHHLTLNVLTDQNRQESHLLRDPNALGDLTARYLNAIRLPAEKLDDWFKDGAEPDQLPNHCAECPYRQPCHAAFGYVNVNNAQNKTAQLGLYPFNQQAIVTMYHNIEQKSRTPRTLLNSIVAYVLNSHGQLIERGLFPPPRIEIGNDFSAPNLREFAQRDLLNHLPKNEQEQIESLAVFWGDRTLNKGHTPTGEPTIGGLTAGIYTAFSLPFIGDGTEVADTLPSVKPPSAEEPVPTPPAPSRLEPPAQTPQYEEPDPILIDIDNWISGHEQLRYYNDLATLLARFVKESIDWDAHSISPTLVTDRIRQRFFVIEGQAGRISQTYHLFFERSRSLAAALQALHQLNQKDRSLTPAQYGAYLLKLSTWLEETESQIVDFVREPHLKTPSSIPSVKLLGQSALWLGCLSGDLSQEATSPSVLFHSLISSCQAIKWADAIDQAQGVRGTKWTQLMARRQISENVALIRSELLEQVNCRQGPRGDLKMLDAATLLDMLQEMKSTDWQLLPKCDFRVEDDNRIWTAIRDVHSSLREHFRAVLSAEHQALTNLTKQIGTAIGDHTIAETFAAIQNLLDGFQNAGLGYRSEYSPPDYESADTDYKQSASLTDLSSFSEQAVAISGALELTRNMTQLATYLKNTITFIEEQQAWLTNQTPKGTATTDLDKLIEDVEAVYTDLEQRLAQLSQEVLQT